MPRVSQLTADDRWLALQHRCWHTVIGSGLPRRLRPGFWDNSGRCCGTAGVLALACDRAVETGGGLGFATVLLRYARIVDSRDPSYAVPWPDHPATG